DRRGHRLLGMRPCSCGASEWRRSWTSAGRGARPARLQTGSPSSRSCADLAGLEAEQHCDLMALAALALHAAFEHLEHQARLEAVRRCPIAHRRSAALELGAHLGGRFYLPIEIVRSRLYRASRVHVACCFL